MTIEEGISLVVQWLRRYVSAAESKGSVPGWAIKVPQANGVVKKSKEKENRREPIKKKKKKTTEFFRRLKNQDSGLSWWSRG